MQLTVTGRHMEVTEAMKGYARQKLERVSLECPRILGARLIMEIEKYRHRAEVVLQSPNITITCARETGDMYASINQAMHCIEGQLKRYKERLQAHKPRHAKEVYTPIDIMEDEKGEGAPRIVRTETIAVKPMHLDEAILQIELGQLHFLVFLDAMGGRRHLLIRLDEGAFGFYDWRRARLKGGRMKVRMKIFSSEGLEKLSAPPRRLRTKKVYIEVLSHQDARDRLAASGRTFVLFHNSESDERSILFKLRSGGFGLIQASGE